MCGTTYTGTAPEGASNPNSNVFLRMEYSYRANGVLQTRIQMGRVAVGGRVKNVKTAIPVFGQKTAVNGEIHFPDIPEDREVSWMHPNAIHHGELCFEFAWAIVRDGKTIRQRTAEHDNPVDVVDTVEEIFDAITALLHGRL